MYRNPAPPKNGVNVIPIEPENKIYYIIQFGILGAYIICAILATFKIRQKYSDSSLYILIFFVYLPILEAYPTIYVWYDYNTNKNLATDVNYLISGFIIGFGMAKVIFYFIKLTFILVRTEELECQEWVHHLFYLLG